MTRPHATLRIPLSDEATAHRIESALRADDDAFVQTRREGATLVVEAEAANLRSLLRALDDALAGASVSEDLLRGPPFDEDSA